MTEQEVQPSALVRDFAAKYGQSESEAASTLLNTIMPGGKATVAQVHALLIVARELDLNPWTREIYAYPNGGGIMPVVGLDGWLKLANNHPQFDGYDLEFYDEGDDRVCRISVYRKDRAHPVVHLEYLSECRRNTQPWKQMERRMHGNRATCQGLRRAFSFSGIMDPDEAAQAVEMRDLERTVDVESAEKASPQDLLSSMSKALDKEEAEYEAANVLPDEDAVAADLAELDAALAAEADERV